MNIEWEESRSSRENRTNKFGALSGEPSEYHTKVWSLKHDRPVHRVIQLVNSWAVRGRLHSGPFKTADDAKRHVKAMTSVKPKGKGS